MMFKDQFFKKQEANRNSRKSIENANIDTFTVYHIREISISTSDLRCVITDHKSHKCIFQFRNYKYSCRLIKV